jgi:hypothetical protein
VYGNGHEDVLSAVSLQVQAAWLRPNLLRLANAWLLQAQPDNAARVVNLIHGTYKWAEVQVAPRMHPRVLQLGLGGPSVAAAVAATGGGRPERVQVSYAVGAWMVAVGHVAFFQGMLVAPACTHSMRCPRRSL